MCVQKILILLISQIVHMCVKPVVQTDYLPPARTLKGHISTWKVIRSDLDFLWNPKEHDLTFHNT